MTEHGHLGGPPSRLTAETLADLLGRFNLLTEEEAELLTELLGQVGGLTAAAGMWSETEAGPDGPLKTLHTRLSFGQYAGEVAVMLGAEVGQVEAELDRVTDLLGDGEHEAARKAAITLAGTIADSIIHSENPAAGMLAAGAVTLWADDPLWQEACAAPAQTPKGT